MAVQVNRFSDQAKRANWRNSFLWFEGIFYFFQGFYLMGNSTFLNVSLANFGLAIDQQAAIFAAIGIPTYLKMFIGLLSDRLPLAKFGRRKPYILLGGFLYIPAFALLFGLQDFNWLWVAAAVAVQFAWVLVDTTLDALTVDVTPDEYAGKMQSAAQGARMAGMGLGILVVPMVGSRIGWGPTVGIIALFAVIQAAAALLFREQPISRANLKEEQPLLPVIKNTFTKKLPWLSIIYAIFFMGSIGLGSVINMYLLTELGWRNTPALMDVYGSANLVHYGAATLGSLLIAPLFAKNKNNSAFYGLVSVFFWVSILPWFLVGNTAERLVWVYVAQFTYGIGRGMMTVLVYSVVMRVCPKTLEGFMFATLTSAMNIGLYTITPNTMAFFAERIGLAPSMFTAIPYTIIGLIALEFILRDLAKRDRAAVQAVVSDT
jgi:MFS family permease